MNYPHTKIEKKWQAFWKKKRLYEAKNTSTKKKYYTLVEFPYPSGDGLHVGHVRSYTALDVISRKRRFEGYNVIYPIGYDSFGLPTENYAIKTGIAPQVATKKNTKTFRRQLESLGFSFDWSREVDTSDPQYYRWTQWLFLQFYKAGLAYKAKTLINWCPSCRIGLANEEATGGVCERCGSKVEKKEKSQWMLKITAYADKLLKGLEKVDFLPEIKTQQRNWIGRSEGREINFSGISIFTTRPDTIDCVTFLCLAPEHSLVQKMLSGEVRIGNKDVVKKYVDEAMSKTDRVREEAKEKTGVLIEDYSVINSFNGDSIPIYVADYVLGHYGTGAVMGVPAHDLRDQAFAGIFNIPVKDAPLITDEKQWPGKKKVTYKLRDWVFSRQRYWGEPIPMIICNACGFQPVPERDLPVLLPKVKDYRPREDGESPLASLSSFVSVKCPKCKGKAQRETDTMPNWAGSSWYFLRYLDSKNKKAFADKRIIKKFLPVDWYNGGMEHVTLHLLYSRFWNIFLHDRGLVSVSEPYKKRTAHGLILGEGGIKMSKSKGNVVNPDTLVKTFGADALRLYEMFIGPFSESTPWDPQGIVGTHRFLNRIHRLYVATFKNKKGGKKAVKKIPVDSTLISLLNKTIKKVSEDIEEMRFNTAVSELMICFRALEDAQASLKAGSVLSKELFTSFLILLSPFSPHLAAECWELLGKKGLIEVQKWPTYSQKLIKEEQVEIVMQINNKVKGKLMIPSGATQAEVEILIGLAPNLERHLLGTTIKKIIFVPGRLINYII
ncbi:MAG: leucine--tRNA ligase [Candidatus Harrisonbacteria bacterium]|nr:leucine--tRNA ligase [Candidatus Harrisonbacteria bacterium]